jgi:hypothetical protein
MKKKIGEIYNKPIVIGNKNEITKNEVHIDNLGGSTSGEGGGSASTMEYIDVRNIDEDLKWSLINSSYLVKISKEGYIYIYPALFAKYDFDELYLYTNAIAIDFSASVAFNNETMTIKEMISRDNGYPLDVFDSIPRITKEEFYSLDVPEVEG